jgi:hypothetical protein
MQTDFERGYAFFRQWPKDNLLLWARDRETGRKAMELIGRKLAESNGKRKG